jgi:hypothetical protein
VARDITWAGGEHAVDLKIEHLRALQDACDAGPEWILSRLMTKQWRVDDVIATIRLGLEGGGMAKDAARRLVALHVESRPLTLSVLTAQAVLMLALYGDPDDQPGEAGAGGEAEVDPNLSREASGDGASSTVGAEYSGATSGP